MLNRTDNSRSPHLLVASVALFFLVFLLFSCSGKKEGGKNVVLESVINAYNSALSDVYRDHNPSYIKPYCTAGQMHRLTSIVQGMIDEKQFLSIEQESIEFLSVVVNGDEAEVRTRERWTFWNEADETKEPMNSKATEEYEITYTLRKEKGKWLVDKLENA